MKGSIYSAAVLCGAILMSGNSGWSQATPPDPNPAMNEPDKVAWQLFIQVNTKAGAAGNNAMFETWASDTDTFTMNPQFPASPAPLALRPPIIPTVGREALKESGALLPAIPPNPNLGEESRRNKATFDFIVQNNLYKVSGLRAAFGKSLSFPIDSIEVKAKLASRFGYSGLHAQSDHSRGRAAGIPREHRERRQAICAGGNVCHQQARPKLDVGDV